MSIMYCEYCHWYIDTDFDSEHFDEDGTCFEEMEVKAMEEAGITTKKIEEEE